MSAPPRTPLRKVLSPNQSHSTSTNSRQTTPTSISKKPSGASPAVRAAIAAARKQRPPPPSFLLESEIPVTTTTTITNSNDSKEFGGFGGIDEGITLKKDSEELLNEWGLKDLNSLIDSARVSGRLNLPSRSLQIIPPLTYSALIAESNPFHPSAKLPKTVRVPRIDYTITPIMNDEPVAPVWFEQIDLLTLNVGNNEIRLLDDEIGGMEWLETLDLHNNYLHKLPLSICFLRSLTYLNLASNHIAEFPHQILSLVSLRELNLSSNLLDTLWTASWEIELTELLYDTRNPPISPSASPSQGASATLKGHFGEFSHDNATPEDPTPFPHLKKLNLSGNRFKKATFTKGIIFPASLVELDLSDNGIRERDIDLSLFSGLKRLEILNIGGNEIGDDWFSGSSTTKLFPSLTRLDLSKGDLEELGQLEIYLKGCAGVKKLEWVGLPKIIANLVHASGVLSDMNGNNNESNGSNQSIEIRVTGNPLSHEQVRRRATFPSSSISSAYSHDSSSSSYIGTPSATPIMSRTATSIPPIPESPTKKKIAKEEWEIQAEAGLATEGGRRRARIEAARREKEDKEAFQAAKVAKARMLLEEVEVVQVCSPPPPPPIELALPIFVASPITPELIPIPLTIVEEEIDTTSSDPLAIELINTSTSSANFSKRSLSSFPSPSSRRRTSPIPSSFDLSHNSFTSIPITSLIAWNWTSLRSLNLSHNKLSSHDLISTFDETLYNLVELNLAYNQLNSTISSETSTLDLFNFISTLTPNLNSLDLSYNNLTNTKCISELLTNSNGTEGVVVGKGIKELNLRGNKIIDLEGLSEFAKEIGGGGGGNNAWKKVDWNCITLDLQDNQIGRLPPVLGLLPADLGLLVAGNPFRLPRPEVYIDGGSRGLLLWLKDRA